MSPRRATSGGLIDRSRSVRFTFDGQDFTGHPGDTLASALLANGVSLFGRSFKYHRPRGVLAAGVDEPNALVTVLRGEAREPNIQATMLEIRDGLKVVSQNRFPTLGFDVGAANQLGGKLIGAGGGGFLMFYAGDKTRLRHAMREKGLQEVRFRFDFEGSKVVAQN